jgi:D-alanine transfer protein
LPDTFSANRLPDKHSYTAGFLVVLAGVVLAITGFFMLPDVLWQSLDTKAPSASSSFEGVYLDDLKSDSAGFNWLQRKIHGGSQLVILGSSELSHSNLPHIPYRFLNELSPGSCVAFGKAGFQCAAILNILAAAEVDSNSAAISIILSPGWFEGKSASGTDPAVMLDFFPPSVQARVEGISAFPRSGRFWYRNAGEFTRNPTPQQLLAFKFSESRSVMNSILFYPLVTLTELYIRQFYEKPVAPVFRRVEFNPVKLPSWDSLYQSALSKQLQRARGNSLGIDDAYYDAYLRNKQHRKVSPPKILNNDELDDFCDLIDFLHERKVKASFVIQPLHPGVYTNLESLNFVLNKIETEIRKAQYPFLNLMPGTSSSYSAGILDDIMHLGDAGWVKIDSFLVAHHYHAE